MNFNKLITIILCVEVFLAPLFFLPWSSATGGYGAPILFNKAVLLVIFTLTALFLFLGQAVQAGRVKLQRTAFDFFVAFFVLAYTLAFAFSQDRYVSLFHWLTILFLAIFYFLVVNVMEKREKLLACFLGSLSLSAVLFLVSALLPFLRAKIGGIINPLASQAHLAALLAVGAIIAQTFLLRHIKGNDGQGKNAKIIRRLRLVGYIAALVLFLVVIALVNFVLGWVLLAIGSLVLVSVTMAKAASLDFKKSMVFLPLAVSLVSLFALFLGAPRLYDAKLPVEASLSQSVSLEIGFRSAVKNVFGAGPGNFGAAFSKYKPEDLSQSFLWQARFNQPSSQFADILATTGFMGLLGFLALAIFGLVVLFVRGQWLAVLLTALAAGWYLGFTIPWWLLLFALLAVEAPRRDAKLFEFSLKKSSNGLFGLSLVFVASLVFVIFFLSFIGKIYLADYYYRQADIASALKYNSKEAGYYLAQADKVFGSAMSVGEAGDKTQILTLVGQSLNYSKAAFDLSPNSAGVCEIRAALLEKARPFIAGSNDWTIRTYQRCLVLEPANPLFHQQLGIAYDVQGDSDKALSQLQKAVELRPQLATAQYELGRLYYNKNDMARAEESFNGAVAAAPDYSNALYSLALVYQKQGKNSAALQLLRRVLELNPGSQDVRNKIREFGG